MVPGLIDLFVSRSLCYEQHRIGHQIKKRKTIFEVVAKNPKLKCDLQVHVLYMDIDVSPLHAWKPEET